MWNGVITNAGAALLASWAAAGGTLKIEAAWAGSGTVGTFEMLSQTSLVNPMHQLSIVGKNKIEKGTRLHLQHVAANTAYVATQLGIFARLDDGESTLIALYQDETGVDIPAVSEMPDFVYVFFTSLIFDNTGDYTVNVDSTALVSYAALEERLKSFEVTVDDTVTADGANAVTGAAVYAFVEAAVPKQVPASNVTAGTLAGQVQANEAAAAVVSVPQLRNIVMVTDDPGADVAVDYPDGTVIHVYE